jgi:hypothetical protein
MNIVILFQFSMDMFYYQVSNIMSSREKRDQLFLTEFERKFHFS